MALLNPVGFALAEPRLLERVTVNQSELLERYAPPRAEGQLSLGVSDWREQDAITGEPFELRTLRLEGATLLSEARLAPLWQPWLGRRVTPAQLHRLAEAIEREYLREGYLVVVAVPEQRLDDGEARLRVFDQSYIREVTLEGDVALRDGALKPYVDRLLAMQPLRLAEIERVLLLMSDMAGLDVQAELGRPQSPGNGGALTLGLRLTPWQGHVGLENSGSEEVGPWQLSASLQANNLLGLMETSSLVAVTVPDASRELRLLAWSQDFPVGVRGWHLGYALSWVRSEPGGELRALDVIASTREAQLYARYPVVRGIRASLFGELALKAQDDELELLSQRQSRDRYRWLELALQGDYLASARAALDYRLALRQGLDALGASDDDDPERSRPGARNDFSLLALEASLSGALSPRWRYTLALAAQAGFNELPSAARFSLGGADYGRAWEAGTLSGDSGLGLSLELALADPLGQPWTAGVQLFGFLDYGAVWNRGDSEPVDHARFGSAGLGLRGPLPGGLHAELMLAAPVEHHGVEPEDDLRAVLQLVRPF